MALTGTKRAHVVQQSAGPAAFGVATAEGDTVPLEPSGLPLAEHEGALLGFAREAQDPLGARLEFVAKAHAREAYGTDLEAPL
jgi:hypothetical protein